MTATGMVMGTVDYIAPEQARGLEVDGRADIYCLGVLFYQLLSGRLPFTADTPTAMMFQHAYEDPFPLSQAVANLPAAVYQIVDRMMAKDRAARYATCADALADIQAFRENRPLAAKAAPESGDAVRSWTGHSPDPKSGRSRTGHSSGPKSGDFSYEEVDRTSEFAPAENVELPADLDELADGSPLRRIRDFAATMFRRHAPEFVQNLQSTTQQVDGALAHYERRRNRLVELLAEARGIEAELSQQKSANEAAAAAAAKAESSGGEEQRRQRRLGSRSATGRSWLCKPNSTNSASRSKNWNCNCRKPTPRWPGSAASATCSEPDGRSGTGARFDDTPRRRRPQVIAVVALGVVAIAARSCYRYPYSAAWPADRRLRTCR